MVVGFQTADDAGVVRLNSDTCLVQTVDFLTPIADDPYIYGGIAAANALSDVYAMGGRPVSALNILCWPEGELDESVLTELLAGGLDKVMESGAVLLGGHSVKDAELKYGLSVTGVIEEHQIWTNSNAQPGDVLILTKALGTGIISTALKREACGDQAWSAAEASMLQLNRESRDALRGLEVHAVTDVTGFGLAGHAWEMARGSGVTVEIEVERLPELPSARELAARGFVTGGSRSNRAYVGAGLEDRGVTAEDMALVLDPQTSGGLLVSLPRADADRFLSAAEGRLVGSVSVGPARVSLA